MKSLKNYDTYSANPSQIANAVRNNTSLPSKKIKSQTRNTVICGKQLQNNVKNHCIVKTLVNGGS